MSNLILIILLLMSCAGSAQCLNISGPAPSSSNFNSGLKDANGNDQRWRVSLDEMAGPYLPAVAMSALPPVFYNSQSWISFSAQGIHTGNRFIFYKIEFELPCYNECNQSFADPFTFCLNLTLYADNSIKEIFVNGRPQSSELPALIHHNDPFNPGPQYTQSTPIPVTLCKDWKPGTNSLIIQIASSATLAGINIEGRDQQETIPILRKEICKGSEYLGFTRTGRYLHHYKGVNGCDSTRMIDLTVIDPSPPDFGKVKGICDGDSMLLSPGKYASYLWNDGSRNESLTIYRPGNYSVTVQDACKTTTTEVVIPRGACGVFYPNAFTANGDGRNDLFQIRSDLVLENFSLIVFNRWGQKVFDSKSPFAGWDGTLNGNLQPAGTYVWKCRYQRLGKIINQKGMVLLIR